MASMKITPAHYAYIRDAIGRKYTADQVKAYTARIEREGKAKDVGMRVRWDFMWHSIEPAWVCSKLYPYADDTHIDTALRAIMRELYGIG
jgi:hypothetical protein